MPNLYKNICPYALQVGKTAVPPGGEFDLDEALVGFDRELVDKSVLLFVRRVEPVLRHYLLLDWNNYEDLFFLFVDVTGREMVVRKQIADREAAKERKDGDHRVGIDIVASLEASSIQSEVPLVYGRKNYRAVGWEEILSLDDGVRKW